MDSGERAWIDRQNYLLATGQWAYYGQELHPASAIPRVEDSPRTPPLPLPPSEDILTLIRRASDVVLGGNLQMTEWSAAGRPRRQRPLAGGPPGEPQPVSDPLGLREPVRTEWRGPQPHRHDGRPWWIPVSYFTGAAVVARWNGEMQTNSHGNYRHAYTLWMTTDARVFALAHFAPLPHERSSVGLGITAEGLPGGRPEWHLKPVPIAEFTATDWEQITSTCVDHSMYDSRGYVTELLLRVAGPAEWPENAAAGRTPARMTHLQTLVRAGRLTAHEAVDLADADGSVSDAAWARIRDL